MARLRDLTGWRRALCIVAHMDDEALFCGGLLLKLADAGCELSLVSVCDARQTNAAPECRRNSRQEAQRVARREAAWQRSCFVLSGRPGLNLGGRNLRHDSTEIDMALLSWTRAAIRDHMRGFDLVISHGPDGEYGHAMHKLVSAAVAAESPVWWLAFARQHGSLDVPINLAGKRRLLDLYRTGTTQQDEWNPFDMPCYADWCRDIESFDWQRPRQEYGTNGTCRP